MKIDPKVLSLANQLVESRSECDRLARRNAQLVIELNEAAKSIALANKIRDAVNLDKPQRMLQRP